MLGLNKESAIRSARRRLRIKKKIQGTLERPRLVVSRSLKHIYAQLVDDASGKVLLTVSTLSPAVRDATPETKGKKAYAKLVGKEIALRAKAQGIEQVVFDRNIYIYHGRIKALAEGAREAGLLF